MTTHLTGSVVPEYPCIPVTHLSWVYPYPCHALGIGDIPITVPNGHTTTTICLTSVLYSTSIGVTLISVRCIDNTGYMSLFGKGCCKICRANGELIGTILKGQALYCII
jgi:hypothetical protein